MADHWEHWLEMLPGTKQKVAEQPKPNVRWTILRSLSDNDLMRYPGSMPGWLLDKSQCLIRKCRGS